MENILASFCGTESSLLFTSGYALNTGIYMAIIGANDVVFSDALNHASIIDGLRLTKAQRRFIDIKTLITAKELLTS